MLLDFATESFYDQSFKTSSEIKVILLSKSITKMKIQKKVLISFLHFRLRREKVLFRIDFKIYWVTTKYAPKYGNSVRLFPIIAFDFLFPKTEALIIDV